MGAKDSSPERWGIIEALLFVTPEPLPLERLAEVAGLTPLEVRAILADLRHAYGREGHAFAVEEAAGGFRLVTRPDYDPWVRKLQAVAPSPLSQAALETLAIVAYRQPVTRAEVEAVRGVAADRPLQTLLDRRLLKEAGRKQAPGRPILYVTTAEFLQHFGLKDLSALPPLGAAESGPGPGDGGESLHNLAEVGED